MLKRWMYRKVYSCCSEIHHICKKHFYPQVLCLVAFRLVTVLIRGACTDFWHACPAFLSTLACDIIYLPQEVACINEWVAHGSLFFLLISISSYDTEFVNTDPPPTQPPPPFPDRPADTYPFLISTYRNGVTKPCTACAACAESEVVCLQCHSSRDAQQCNHSCGRLRKSGPSVPAVLCMDQMGGKLHKIVSALEFALLSAWWRLCRMHFLHNVYLPQGLTLLDSNFRFSPWTCVDQETLYHA